MFAAAVFDVVSDRITATTVEVMSRPMPLWIENHFVKPRPIASASPVSNDSVPSAKPPP
jgi:hypothetical protein